MFTRSALIAAALALVAVLPLHAAEADEAVLATGAADGERGKERASERNRDSGRRETGARAGDDLETCKRDADGMRGPERSRFMTQCLKERK